MIDPIGRITAKDVASGWKGMCPECGTTKAIGRKMTIQ